MGLIRNCYNDCAQRTLSVRESEKLNRMFTTALQTFREFAAKDNVYAWEMAIDQIDPLLGKYFEMTIPDSPNNPGQKYYLTALGKALLDND